MHFNLKRPLQLLCCLLVVSSCKKEDVDIALPQAPTAPQSSSQSLPSTVSGKVINMEFSHAESGAPYTLKQKVRFTFSSSGALFLDTNPSAADGDEVTVSQYTLKGSEYIWEDVKGGYKYALSLKSDSSINEINVSTSADLFKGQFTPIQQDNSPIGVIKSMEGTYTVSRALKGTHTRMTVVIDKDGNIDFDTNVQLKASDYVLITDKRKDTYMVFIDLKPYQTEPYPRVKIKVKAATQKPEIMSYYPEYPKINGRVEILF